jgi:hypothetical protein
MLWLQITFSINYVDVFDQEWDCVVVMTGSSWKSYVYVNSASARHFALLPPGSALVTFYFPGGALPFKKKSFFLVIW